MNFCFYICVSNICVYMANHKKYKDPIRKIFMIEREHSEFISDLSKAKGTPDSDFINEAITEKINRIKLEDTLKESN